MATIQEQRGLRYHWAQRDKATTFKILIITHYYSNPSPILTYINQEQQH